MKRHISPAVKDALTRVYLVQRSRGISIKSFWRDLKEANIPVAYTTFNEWVTSFERKGRIGVEEKKSGRKPILCADERAILTGYVLHCNESNEEVHLTDVVDAAKQLFGITIGKTTAHRLLESEGFRSKRVQRRAQGYQSTIQSLQVCAMKWVDQQRKMGAFDRPLSRLCSVDFTFTGHRTDSRSTYHLSGAGQPRTQSAHTIFTNCIVTCVWADGRNRTPSVLFTYNQRFRFDRPSTARRADDVRHLRRCLSKYRVRKNRVVYVGKSTGETRTYVAECSDLLDRFFELYKIPDETVIFSDNGRSFFVDGESVFDGTCWHRHATYPASVHHVLSPNDNRLHGAAKQKWRAARSDFVDDVDACLQLLSLLDQQSEKHSRSWFQTNLLSLAPDNIDSLFGAETWRDSPYYQNCIDAYRKTQRLDCRKEVTPISTQLMTTLDGPYFVAKRPRRR